MGPAPAGDVFSLSAFASGVSTGGAVDAVSCPPGGCGASHGPSVSMGALLKTNFSRGGNSRILSLFSTFYVP